MAKKIDYWSTEEDKLVIEWATANKKDRLRIYNALLPKLVYMADGINARYFHFGAHESQEIVQDAINDLFINMHMYKPNKGSCYSYSGTIIKNQMVNTLRKQNLVTKPVLEFYGDDGDEDSEFGFELKYEKELVYNPFDDDGQSTLMEEVLKRFAEFKREHCYKATTKIHHVTKSVILEECKFIDVCVEFLNKFGNSQGVEIRDLLEYVVENYKGRTAFTIRKYVKKYFGKGCALPTKEVFNVEKRYNLNLINDDHCPNDGAHTIMFRRKGLTASSEYRRLAAKKVAEGRELKKRNYYKVKKLKDKLDLQKIESIYI